MFFKYFLKNFSKNKFLSLLPQSITNLHNDFPVHFPFIKGNTGLADIIEVICCADQRLKLMFIHKAEDILHHLCCRIVAVKPGQAHAVRNILDGIEMIPLIYFSKHTGIAYDPAMLLYHPLRNPYRRYRHRLQFRRVQLHPAPCPGSVYEGKNKQIILVPQFYIFSQFVALC